MKSWKTSILVALTVTTLTFSLGVLSALALTRGPKVAPDCGTPSVDTIPCITSGHHDATVQLNGPTRIGGLKVRPGNWFFIAKAILKSTLSSPHSIPCTLTAGPGVDAAASVLPPNQSNTATMTLVQTFASAGIAIVSCDGTTGETVSSLRITAIRAGLLFDQPIS
jgi:hypothetical protein